MNEALRKGVVQQVQVNLQLSSSDIELKKMRRMKFMKNFLSILQSMQSKTVSKTKSGGCCGSSKTVESAMVKSKPTETTSSPKKNSGCCSSQ